LFTARRANGDTVTTVVSGARNPKENGYSTLELVSQGLMIVFINGSGNQYVSTLGKGVPLMVQDNPGSCESEGTLVPGDTKQIAGVTAVHIQATSDEPNGRWVAPDLNCFVVEKEETTQSVPTWWSRQTTNQIVLGAPPDALFAVPAGRTEAKPSVFYASMGRVYPANSTYIAKRDMAYQNDLAARSAASPVW
jgi:hypothetical protein